MDLTDDNKGAYGAMLGRRYAMLPVDEEVFKIDANTRMIEVPENFGKNGIAVQGDEVAEVIYFKIARYFDFMDLNNTEIYIQYEDPTGHKDVCQEWVRDIESDPDYLIFGWALGDPVTKHAGRLKFSVRFIAWDEETGKPLYSLSTIETGAHINSSLNLNIDAVSAKDENDKIVETIRKRIKTSYITQADKADIPVYSLTLEQWVKQKENSDTEIYIVDLVNGEYEFRAQAYSTDAGSISYTWEKDGEELKDSNIPVYVKVEPIYPEGYDPDIEGELKPEAYAGHTYYIEEIDSQGNKTYTVDSTLKPGDIIENDRYELYASYKANKAGKYKAVAINSIGQYSSTALSSEKAIEIPGPVKPVCVPDGSIGNIIAKIAENEYKVTLKVEPVIEKDIEKYKFEYQWYKGGTKEENKIEGAVGSEYTISLVDDSDNNIQGRYYAQIIAYRNNVPTDAFSKAFLVSYTADSITEVKLFDQDNQPITIVTGAKVNDTLTAQPEFAKNYQIHESDFEEITYQWNTIKSQKGEPDTLIPIGESTKVPKLELTSNLLGKRICCVVTNVYNNTTTSRPSDIITVSE